MVSTSVKCKSKRNHTVFNVLHVPNHRKSTYSVAGICVILKMSRLASIPSFSQSLFLFSPLVWKSKRHRQMSRMWCPDWGTEIPCCSCRKCNSAVSILWKFPHFCCKNLLYNIIRYLAFFCSLPNIISADFRGAAPMSLIPAKPLPRSIPHHCGATRGSQEETLDLWLATF